MNSTRVKKIISAASKNVLIRVMFLLTILFIAILGTLILMAFTFQKRMESIDGQIKDTQVQIENLQKTVEEGGEDTEKEVIERQFAPYEEIVPFIGLLESLFGLIDPKASIAIKDEEKQIFTNRYADYEVKMSVGSKKNLLFKALNELYQSSYLTRIMNFNMDYSPIEGEEGSEFEKITFIIRLYFE